MNDQNKSKEQLIAELAEMRQRIVELESTRNGFGEASSHLAPSHPWWLSMTANTPVVILILDRDHRVRYVNHADSNTSPDEVIGRTPYDFSEPENHDTIRECLDRVLETGEPGTYESAARRLDGQQHWYESHVGPIMEDGEVVALSVILVNATARKQIEQERDRVYTILTAAIECLPFDFFALGPDGRYMLANAVAKMPYGDIVGKTPEELCPNEADLAVWLENNRRAFAGERVEGEVDLVVHGENRHYYNIVAPIRDNDTIYGILGVNVDITERKRAEQQMKDSERRFRLLAERIQDVFWISTPGVNDQIYVSPAYETSWGRSVEECMSNPRTFMESIHAEDRERYETALEEFHAGCRPYTCEYRIVRPDGTIRWIEERGFPVTDDQGDVHLMTGVCEDITERKRAEERSRLAAQVATDLIYEWNVHDDTLEWFGPLDETLGYPVGEIPRIIDGWVQLMHPEDLTRLKDSVERHRTSTEPIYEEYRMRHRDGGWRHWIDRGTPILDEQGRPVKWIGACVDVTERREAEAALCESEERFRSLFEEAHDGILLANADTKQLGMANRAICTMMGYSKEEFEQLHVRDIHPEADLPYVVDQFEKLARGELQVAVDIPMKSKDGAVFYADVSSGSVNLKGQHFLIGQFRDVTQRRQAQEELIARVRQLATLNNMSRRVGSRLDLNEAVQQALEGLKEELGTDEHLLFLRREGDEDLVQFHPSTARFSCEAITARGVGECWFGRAFSSREPVYSRDISEDTRCTRGECRQAGFRSLAALPLMSGDEAFGVLALTSSTIRDFRGESSFLETLTNEIAAGLHNARLYDELRKNRNELASAFEQIQRTNAELERRVEQRTAEIRSANEELEAYASSVSHDLRAPLRGMTGFANLLAEDYADCLDATGREYCQYIADSAARMDELINDLLDYSRLGRSELLMQAVSLESAIREAIGQLESEIKERQASVVVEGLLPDVMGHQKMLVQISANLIGNAVKFVAPDVRPKVRIWAERREPLIRLWVEDNGIGIDDECHEQIFRVFERLHGIESYPGTGVGLAIVGRVVSRLGGRYGVESQLGEGSRFWVEFRAAREDDS